MAAVELSIPAGAEHVRIVRLVAVATARVAGVAEDAMDDIRLAVDEASSRAVRLNAEHCPDEPVRIIADTVNDAFSVTVSDSVPQPEPHVGLALLTPSDVDALPPDNGAARRPDGGSGEQSGLMHTVLPDDFGLALVRGLVEDVRVTRRETGSDVRLAWPLAGT